MNELNSDLVLWLSLAAIVATIVSLVGFAWKSVRGMEGLEKDKEDS